jgi:two-component system alkaline phosphatase synthesis response regulator PhoP
MQAKILIVEDDLDIVEFLEYNLSKEGFIIEKAYDGVEGLEKAAKFKPHLILLDIMMPNMDGIECCTELRSNSNFRDTIIVFLTARSESFTQVSALDAGGDDFITKPTKPNVLKSKLRALLRRHPAFQEEVQPDEIVFGDLKIFPDSFSISVEGKMTSLAKKEFELLALLISKPGKVFKREEIMNKVWGSEVIVGDRTIDVHVRKLREKIGSNYIKTTKGVGYQFKV